MDRIPVNVQRHIAGFATEAGEQVRSGGRFLGRERDLWDEQNKCVCGICVRTRNQPREKCTLFREDRALQTCLHVAFPAAHAREIYRSLIDTAFEACHQPDPPADANSAEGR